MQLHVQTKTDIRKNNRLCLVPLKWSRHQCALNISGKINDFPCVCVWYLMTKWIPRKKSTIQIRERRPILSQCCFSREYLLWLVSYLFISAIQSPWHELPNIQERGPCKGYWRLWATKGFVHLSKYFRSYFFIHFWS